jgi:hypothetical protein
VGVVYGAAGLPLAALLLSYSWTSDVLDGSIARRSRVYYHTWLGDHDLEVDMAVAAGVLIYLLAANFISLPAGAAYAIVWVIIILFLGFYRSLGMLFQAPLYLALIVLSLRDEFYYGLLLVVWILAATILTWPRFPREVVPGFINGIKVINIRRR